MQLRQVKTQKLTELDFSIFISIITVFNNVNDTQIETNKFIYICRQILLALYNSTYYQYVNIQSIKTFCLNNWANGLEIDC